MTLYSDIDQIRAATSARHTSVGDWTQTRQLAALEFEDEQRKHRAKLEAEREAKVEQMSCAAYRALSARLHANAALPSDLTEITQAAWSPEHGQRMADALRRGLRSVAFVQFRIGLRRIRDDLYDKADDIVPDVTYQPRRVLLGDEIREAHRTFRITGGL
jgi:hypothetical protein